MEPASASCQMSETQLPRLRSTQKLRWNFKKANWEWYTKEIDSNVLWILPSIKKLSLIYESHNSSSKM